MTSNSKIYDRVDAIFEWFNGTKKNVVTFAFTSEEKESLVKTLQNLEGGNGQLWQDHQVNNEAIAVQ